eukprot:CAMPEP_0181527998 /NCGR_PEP_ID=MMETSP1110-20121109/70308_1 /TAXON_ID=174948 /ORGANISM="Symbiodinium sp., Strain CCMP421" /LENGTH=109 /DNA_ID=CAMNT_0023658923 /DNA_START=50 /DNA_END=380 /DNA_ORIENTATION=+
MVWAAWPANPSPPALCDASHAPPRSFLAPRSGPSLDVGVHALLSVSSLPLPGDGVASPEGRASAGASSPLPPAALGDASLLLLLAVQTPLLAYLAPPAISSDEVNAVQV